MVEGRRQAFTSLPVHVHRFSCLALTPARVSVLNRCISTINLSELSILLVFWQKLHRFWQRALILRVYSSKSKSRLSKVPSACYHGSWLRQNPAQWIPRSNDTWLVSTNQRTPRRDVKMARQKLPVLAHYGAGPFNFTISHNSANTNSITSAPGLTDGNIYTLYIDTSMFPLHRVLSKSHSLSTPKLGCVCATAPNPSLLYWSVQGR